MRNGRASGDADSFDWDGRDDDGAVGVSEPDEPRPFGWPSP